MYMLPEAEQTNLKHPISPHPPQPTQFHTPQGNVPLLYYLLKIIAIFSTDKNSQIEDGNAENWNAKAK